MALGLDSSSWINPYKNPLGLGNYDITVLIQVLQARGRRQVCGRLATCTMPHVATPMPFATQVLRYGG